MKSTNKIIAEKVVNLLLNILLVIFGFILLISIYTGIQTKILKKPYSDFFGYSIFEVQTGSMEDTINAGDWIVVKLTNDVKLDDIITYKLGEEFITHRIIEAYNSTYVTKGDANNSKDTPIDKSQIVGKVTNILGNFGVLRKTIFSPAVLIAIIVTLFLFSLAFKKGGKDDKEKSIFKRIINNITAGAKKEKEEFKELENDKPGIEIKEVATSNEKYIVEEKTSEEELEKTSYYRVVSVDGDEVDNKYKENPPKEDSVEEETEDDLEKTAYYRIIPVDASETNETLLEIAENELKEANQKNKNKKEEVEEQVPVLEEENLTNINLGFLKEKRGKKSKNVIETSMLIKKEELSDFFNSLVEEKYNKLGLKEDFIDKYISIKYYNFDESSGKSSATKIRKSFKDYGHYLISSYKGKDKDYKELINIYITAFDLIICLDLAKNSIKDIKVKNEFYKEAINNIYPDWSEDRKKEALNNIINIQKTYKNTLEYFLSTLETSVFNLNFNKIASKKNMFALDLQHNISFSKVYSDYIIDKTYAEGVIAEDKIIVLITLLSIQLINDIVGGDIEKKYILYLPNSLYNKEKKFEKVLKMLDDKYAKSSVYIGVKYEDLLSNKKTIKEVRQFGYKFAIIFDKDEIIQAKDRGDIYVADYIFIDKKVTQKEKITSSIPSELKESIISDDIIDKLGGSE